MPPSKITGIKHETGDQGFDDTISDIDKSGFHTHTTTSESGEFCDTSPTDCDASKDNQRNENLF